MIRFADETLSLDGGVSGAAGIDRNLGLEKYLSPNLVVSFEGIERAGDKVLRESVAQSLAPFAPPSNICLSAGAHATLGVIS